MIKWKMMDSCDEGWREGEHWLRENSSKKKKKQARQGPSGETPEPENRGAEKGFGINGAGVKRKNVLQQFNFARVEFVEDLGLVITLRSVISPSMKLLVAQSAIF